MGRSPACTVPPTHHHLAPRIPTPQSCGAALATHMAAMPGPHLFVTRRGKPLQDIRSSFTAARREAQLGKDVTPHVLRHTFASKLAMAGVDMRTIQELGGWSSLEMVQRYTLAVDPRTRRRPWERIVSTGRATGMGSVERHERRLSVV